MYAFIMHADIAFKKYIKINKSMQKSQWIQ